MNDLERPLGLNQTQASIAPRIGLWLTGAVILAALGGGFYFLRTIDSHQGEPIARAKIDIVTPPPTVPSASSSSSQPLTPPMEATGAQVEAASGVKIIRGGASTPNALIIQVPESASASLAPAPDRRLAEHSRFGVLPRIGSDGARAFDVYARPFSVPPTMKPNAPRIALLVGGMGLNLGLTMQAVEKLPRAVSLAFAPYGADLEKQTAAARAEGHEFFMQIPMEGFDYAQNPPGPHTVLAGDPGKMLDDLHWSMGRAVGYVGLVNFLGGKLTADQTTMTQILRDVEKRGLGYFDDASSPRSVAVQAAKDLSMPSVSADVRLDDDPRPEAIEAALLKLETLARTKGVGIGFAGGLPASIESIAQFARGLERRGVVLTPVSAVMSNQSRK